MLARLTFTVCCFFFSVNASLARTIDKIQVMDKYGSKPQKAVRCDISSAKLVQVARRREDVEDGAKTVAIFAQAAPLVSSLFWDSFV